MKIGIDARMYGPKVSGIGNYVKNLIDNLLDIDHENEYVIFLLKEGFESFSPKQQNVKKVLVNCHWYTWKEQWKYWRILEKEKTDIMHFPNFNVPIFFTRKFVVTIHDMTPWQFPGQKVSESAVRWLAYAMVFNSAVKRAEKIITVSQYSKSEIIKKYAKAAGKISIVYNGVSGSFQRVDNYGIIENIKRKYKIVKPYIFFIGVWRDHKNIPGLIHTFTILKEMHKMDIQLVLGGENTHQYEDIDKAIDESPVMTDILQTGFIPDGELPALYSAAEATVIPSFVEGFGLHAIESILCGTPVVGSLATSLPEVVGDLAVYFDPHNPEDMAKKIKRVLDDPFIKKIIYEKRDKFVQKYSWRTSAVKTLEIYKNTQNEKKKKNK